MKKILDVFIEVLMSIWAALLVLTIFIVPITIILGCIKLTMMMFGG